MSMQDGRARRAVVTGASSGIGEAAARRLRALGWDVVAFARRADRLAALATETGVYPVVGDVTDDGDVARLVAETSARGPVDAIVNVAGFALGADRVDEADLDGWRAMFEANVLGTVRVTRAFLPALRATGGGDVLLLTSTAGHGTYPGGGGYVASKQAMASVASTLRLELGGEPIRVIEIAPGMVRTEGFALTRFGGDQSRADAVYQGVVDPLSADDVADVIEFALTRPAHVNLDTIVVRPVAQSSNTQVTRGELRVRQ
jgi:NADP-dependent 3-hydroxy acid dehydrogenase YdfG